MRYRLIAGLLALGMLVTQVTVVRITQAQPVSSAQRAAAVAESRGRTLAARAKQALLPSAERLPDLAAIARPLRSLLVQPPTPLFILNCSFLN